MVDSFHYHENIVKSIFFSPFLPTSLQYTSNPVLCYCFTPVQTIISDSAPGQGSDGKGETKGKKTSNKPLKILEEDDEDLSALRDPSEKVGGPLTHAERSLVLPHGGAHQG